MMNSLEKAINEIRNTIPNIADVGDDLCLSAIQVTVPMILIDNGDCLSWHPETMDRSAAERMVTAINVQSAAFATIVDVLVILPPASAVGVDLPECGSLDCKPYRAELMQNQGD